MKKFLLIPILLILLYSCEDRIENNFDADDTNSKEIKLVTISADDGKNSVTLLAFEDVDHFEQTITDLENQIETNEDAFVNQYRTLDEEALNAKEEEVGYKTEQPLLDFESQYNIPQSLREVYAAAEEVWMDNDELDPLTDPDKDYPFDETLMTLLNPEGEVQIANRFLKLTNKGFVEIDNLDVTTLIRIDNGDETAYDEPTVYTNIDFDGGSKYACTSWKGKTYKHEYVDNKKLVKRHVQFHCYPWKSVSTTRLKSYKKKNGRWKKHRMQLGVANQANLRNTNCAPKMFMWSDWKRKKRKSLRKRNTNWDSYPQDRAEKNLSIYGKFEYAGHSNTRVLTW